jgi:SPP1 family predicted phage head-tail adaptor
VTVEQPQEAAGPYGEAQTSWSPLATVWASVEPVTGREFFAAAQVQTEVTHRVRMRYLAGVTPKHRIRHGDRLLDVRLVRNLEERNVELELLCVEHGLTGAAS